MSNATLNHSVDVIVCVHNSLLDVERCLGSVKKTLRLGDKLIIVDDGSDSPTKSYCEKVRSELGSEFCLLLRREEGSGFCRAANAGLRESSAETVIILNSDTIVAGDWIERLTGCMVSNWQIGIVGPLSNAGGWQSIPELPSKTMVSNLIYEDSQTISDIHKNCAGNRDHFAFPIVEQINGFCFAISREVINVVGLFDEENFPAGYGEENDFTFRAMDAGFLCAVAIDCFVFHAKTKSYSAEARKELTLRGQSKLHALHGQQRVVDAVVLISTEN